MLSLARVPDWAKTLMVTLLCLTGAVTGSYLYYLDTESSGIGGGGPVVGSLERRQARVRRKPANSFIWSNAKQEDSLHAKESISTGEQSTALIRMANGSQIELGPNSLIVLDNVADVSLNYVQGSIVVRSDKGDKKITVDESGKKKIQQLPVSLLEPSTYFNQYTRDAQPQQMNFRWSIPKANQVAKNQKYELQVGRERTFSIAGTQKINVTKKTRKMISLTPGNYFWRVVGENADEAEIKQFTITSVSSLKATYPSEGTVIQIADSTGTVKFRWLATSLQQGSSHKIEVARDLSFSQMVSSETINPENGSLSVEKIPEGNYFWRLRSQYGDLSMYSRVQPFQVEKTRNIEVDLDEPGKNDSFELQPNLAFQWEAAETADQVEYKWELKNENAQDILNQTVTRGTNHLWTVTGAGKYQWRISVIYKNKVVGVTQWRGFRVFKGKALQLAEPTDKKKILYWDTPEEFEFEWSKDDLGEEDSNRYQLEIANDLEFRRMIKTQKTKDRSIASKDLNLLPGTYFWRVRVVDDQNRSIKVSPTWSITFGNYPTLEAPVAESPQHNHKYDWSDEEKAPVAKWKEVKSADSYEITVYAVEDVGRDLASEGQTKPVMKKVVRDNEYKIENLNEGKYVWVVRAIDPLKRRGKTMQSRSFSINYGELLSAPEITSPEVQ